MTSPASILVAVPKPGRTAKTRKPMRKVNSRRRRQALVEDFGDLAVLVRKMPCCVDGCSQGPSDPAHVRTRGAGLHAWIEIDGVRAGNIAPLCHPHHLEQHRGIKSFNAAHRLVVRWGAFAQPADDLAHAAAMVGRLSEGAL